MGQSSKRKRSSPPIRVHLAWVLLATPSLVVPTSAWAANRQIQERAARKACLTGDFTKGVAILSDLFLDTRDPTYIFNQGRCFEQNRRFEDAIGRFEEYLRTAESSKLDQADRAAAEKHVADCKNSLAQQVGQPVPATVQPPSPPQPQAQVAPSSASAPAPAPETLLATQPLAPETQGSPPSGLRAAGIITASVGGAAVITGIILNLKVNSLANDMKKPGGYSDGKVSQRNTYETLGWLGYGLGAACVATGPSSTSSG